MLLLRYLFLMLLWPAAIMLQKQDFAAQFSVFQQAEKQMPARILQDTLQVSGALADRRNQLPEKLVKILNHRHASWKLPTLPDDYFRKTQKLKQGPYYISGDFNGDNFKDYAVQILRKEKVLILAFITEENSFKEVKITEAQAVKNNKESESIFYICKSPKHTKVFNYRTEKDQLLENDAIIVGTSQSETVFIFRNGKFEEIFSGK